MLGGKNATCHMGMTMDDLMRGSAASKAPNCNHHVELHVFKKSNGSVVKNAKVSITMDGMMKGSKMIMVPIMTMIGQTAKASDYHYGNNVYAPAGTYTVAVSVNGTKASFMGVKVTGGM